MRPILVVALSFAAATSAAIGPHTNLYVKNKYIQPDGFNRSAVLLGDTESCLSFPGPFIRGLKGDTFRLNVIDKLTDTSMLTSTSIHWHGIDQKGSNWADGPVGITQCPIAPGHSFEYQFSVLDQAGTFWYHSHYSTQYCDGLRGPMVVYDPQDPHRSRYDIDDESTIITLADWYHNLSPVLAAIPAPPQPDATLINGRGRSPGGPDVALAVITVSPFRRYRFRLVSISCDPNFTFSIDGHNMTIIEVDSANVQPLVVDSIQIFAGQRYSFVLHADQPISNYWVRSLPNNGPPGFTNGVNSAILRYVAAPNVDPQTTQTTSLRPLVEANLRPLVKAPAPGPPSLGGADVSINLDIALDSTGLFKVNNASFVPPSVPVLLQMLSGAQAAQELLPSGSVYALPSNKVIELTIPGGSVGSPHPIHLHGHSFAVVRSAGSAVYNYDNPVVRDVVNIGVAGDNVTIRFKTDNSGPWIMHCHIDWHLDRGLAVVMAENIPDKLRKEHPPAAWDELCGIFDALPREIHV